MGEIGARQRLCHRGRILRHRLRQATGHRESRGIPGGAGCREGTGLAMPAEIKADMLRNRGYSVLQTAIDGRVLFLPGPVRP